MKNTLPINSEALQALYKATTNGGKLDGHKLYFVGGCVRDFLQGKEPRDYDILLVTNNTNQLTSIEPILNDIGFSFLSKTGIYIDNQGHEIDVAHNLQENLTNRDFTFNSMAVEVETQIDETTPFGVSFVFPENPVIYSPDGILNKTQQKEILGSIKLVKSDSLLNDPIRTIRAMRFLAQNNFNYDEEFVNQIQVATKLFSNKNTDLNLDIGRFTLETNKAFKLTDEQFTKFLNNMWDFGIIQSFYKSEFQKPNIVSLSNKQSTWLNALLPLLDKGFNTLPNYHENNQYAIQLCRSQNEHQLLKDTWELKEILRTNNNHESAANLANRIGGLFRLNRPTPQEHQIVNFELACEAVTQSIVDSDDTMKYIQLSQLKNTQQLLQKLNNNQEYRDQVKLIGQNDKPVYDENNKTMSKKEQINQLTLATLEKHTVELINEQMPNFNSAKHHLVMARGSQGSGKSYFANQLSEKFLQTYPNGKIIHLENDILLTEADGTYNWTKERLKKAISANEKTFHETMKQIQKNGDGLQPTLVINSNMNIQTELCERWLNIAKKAGVKTHFYHLHNAFKNTHGVNGQDVIKSKVRVILNPIPNEIHVPIVKGLNFTGVVDLNSIEFKTALNVVSGNLPFDHENNTFITPEYLRYGTLFHTKPSKKYPELSVLKYTSEAFWGNMFDNALLEMRGTIIDKSGQIIVRPFSKVFNYSERQAENSKYPLHIDDFQKVKAIVKVNGFLGVCTYVQAKNAIDVAAMIGGANYFDKVLYSTTGSLDSDFAKMVEVHCDKKHYTQAFKDYPNHSFMFEITDENDPHIIEEMFGETLIGIRNVQNGQMFTEKELDEIAKKYGMRRPQTIENITFGELKEILKEVKHEGFMVFDENNNMLCKLKSPFYLISKFFGRSNELNLDKKLNKQNVDEEFYPLIDHINENLITFKNMEEKDKIKFIQDFINKDFEPENKPLFELHKWLNECGIKHELHETTDVFNEIAAQKAENNPLFNNDDIHNVLLEQGLKQDEIFKINWILETNAPDLLKSVISDIMKNEAVFDQFIERGGVVIDNNIGTNKNVFENIAQAITGSPAFIQQVANDVLLHLKQDDIHFYYDVKRDLDKTIPNLNLYPDEVCLKKTNKLGL